MDSKFFITAAFFVLIILSGLWLSHLGRPINALILTIHKIISLAGVVFLAITVIRIHQLTPLNPLEIFASAATLFLFIILIASGGLLSTAKTMPEVIHKIHQIMPYLVILATAATLYLLLVRKPLGIA